MITKTNPKVACYLRSANGDADSLKRQKQKLETFISQKPELVNSPVETYTDEIQSGLRPGPEFLRMKQDIMDDKINVVMVSEFDRISRSIIEFLNFLNFLKGKGIPLLSPQENMDAALSPQCDKLMRKMRKTIGELKIG
jgi:DNA invertase Pin-like site-specific DNA recombinase